MGTRQETRALAVWLLILATPVFIWGEAFQWQGNFNINAKQRLELMKFARAVLQETVEGTKHADGTLPVPSIQSGLFVTLVRNGRVRGCYGSLTPEGRNLLSQIHEYTAAAATSDFRNLPVHPSELNDIVIILSFIGPIEPISSLQEVDPKIEGLMVRSGSRAAVLLPGEARTASWQLQEAKRQAGIELREPVELFKIHTVTVYER